MQSPDLKLHEKFFDAVEIITEPDETQVLLPSSPPAEVSLQQPIRTISQRNLSIDWLRGCIMVLMALDHARMLISNVNGRDPEQLHETWYRLPNPSDIPSYLYLLRLLTHPCAPGFFYLMGLSKPLFVQSRLHKYNWTREKIIRYFTIRASVLFLMGEILSFEDLFNKKVYLAVLYALSVNYFYSGLYVLFLSNQSVYLKYIITSLIALVFALFCQVFGPQYSPEMYEKHRQGAFSIWEVMTLIASQSQLSNGWSLFVRYPFLPWLSMTLWGVANGYLLPRLSQRFKARLNFIYGIFFLSLFLLIRGTGGFGNTSAELKAGFSAEWLKWLMVVKYPPSLAYITLTMSSIHLLLSLFTVLESQVIQPVLPTNEQSEPKKSLIEILLMPLKVYGNNALFFYAWHFVIYKLLELFCKRVLGFQQGLDLWGMAVVWLTGLLLLYFMCLQYGKMKQQKPVDSFWRFF